MSEYTDRYRKVADEFTAMVQAVPEAAWDNPAPCEGWVARDVVRHLVEWVPAFFESYWELAFEAGPPVDGDPVGAWLALDHTLTALLDDDEMAASVRETPMGTVTLEAALDMAVTGDIFVHQWDLARATGLDDRLDPDEVHRQFAGMEPMDEALRQSGHFGPRVAVPADADEQTKLIAFLGRDPAFAPPGRR
jgi:uncharacterized protein (TIGR03086 family)